MANINGRPISLYIDHVTSDSSPLARAKMSSSSDSHCPVRNPLVAIIIILTDNYKLERFLNGSLDIETSFNDSSFDTPPF